QSTFLNCCAMKHLAITCLVVTLSFPTLQGQSQGEFEVLKRRYNLSAQQTDFVVMVDFSGSMKRGNAYQALYNVLADLIDAIPDGDYISIQGFSSDVIRNPAGRPVILNPSNRESLKQRIRTMPTPQGYTDIGKAIELCNQELNRPDANTLQFLLFITDGKHDALPNSPYYRITSGPAWDALRQQAELTLYKQGRKLRVVALALTGAEDAPMPDTKLLQQVYRDVQLEEVSQADIPSLKVWFTRLQREIEREKLKALVRTELREPFVCTVPDTIFVREFFGKTASLSYPIRLTNQTDGLTFRIKDIKYIGKYEGEDITVTFKANVNQTQPLSLEPKNLDSSLVLSTADFPLHTSFISNDFLDKVDGSLELTADLEPALELAKLGIQPEQVIFRIPIALSFKETIGFPLWLLVPLTVLLLAILYWVYQTFIKPEYISAKFVVTVGNALPYPIEHRKNEKKTSLKIGKQGEGSARVDGYNAPTVEFFTQKGLARGLYVRLIEGRSKIVQTLSHGKESEVDLTKAPQKVIKNRTQVKNDSFTVEIKS
ncbi:MAG: VWA domain-containing protein, partial [Chloroherpetonaceae bacterium]